MPKTIQLTNGQAVNVVGTQEACDLLDCTLEELSAWVANTWLREFRCECCEASWPLADDIFAVADLAQRYPRTELSELVQRHFERMQRSLQRKQPKGSAPRISPNPHYDPAYQDDQSTAFVEPGRRYGASGRRPLSQSAQKQQQRTSFPFGESEEDATLEYGERDRRAPGRERTLQGREQRRTSTNRTQRQFLPEEIDQFETIQHDRYQASRRTQRQPIEDYETVLQEPYGREADEEMLDHRGRAKRTLAHTIEVQVPEIDSIPRRDPGRRMSPNAKRWWPCR